MHKLLIADHSDTMTDYLSNALLENWEIHICADGFSTDEALRQLDPDAMIINLNLAKKTGLSVLEDNFPNLPPVIMALSTYISPYVQKTVTSLGVGYIMPIPCTLQAVVDRLEDMWEAYNNPPSILSRHLHTIGVNPSQDGYHFLMYAIPKYANNSSLRLHKELYPDVALACGANDRFCVERSIRSAINAAWKKRNMDIWVRYFPLNAENDIDCPSNGDFIARLAEIIKEIPFQR